MFVQLRLSRRGPEIADPFIRVWGVDQASLHSALVNRYAVQGDGGMECWMRGGLETEGVSTGPLAMLPPSKYIGWGV